MKIIRSLWSIVMLFPTAGFFFAGCYTHMETVRDGGPGGGDGDYYAYTDSTNASNDTTGANYFSDDDYRESNYRASFDYYAPPAYIWGSNICYDPWYDDCWYPGSYWYGYYPYWGFGYGYGYGSYYGGGYGYRGYRGGNYYAGRTRTIGTTRGGYGLLGGRSPAGSPSGNPACERRCVNTNTNSECAAGRRSHHVAIALAPGSCLVGTGKNGYRKFFGAEQCHGALTICEREFINCLPEEKYIQSVKELSKRSSGKST